jgi:hypothetical protein
MHKQRQVFNNDSCCSVQSEKKHCTWNSVQCMESHYSILAAIAARTPKISRNGLRTRPNSFRAWKVYDWPALTHFHYPGRANVKTMFQAPSLIAN